jgi:hypothetical protein
LRALLRHGTDPRITRARSDPKSLATLDVLTKLLPPALFSDANLLCLTVCPAVNLSLERGNSDGSCLWYEKCAALKFGALTRRRETTNPVIGAIAVEDSRCAGRVGERYIGVRSEQIRGVQGQARRVMFRSPVTRRVMFRSPVKGGKICPRLRRERWPKNLPRSRPSRRNPPSPVAPPDGITTGQSRSDLRWAAPRGPVKFALDSPLEGTGFELPVPQQIRSHF